MDFPAIALLQDTLDKVMQDDTTAVTLFYARLFTLDPTLLHLLPPDITAHGRSFLHFLRQYTDGLSAPQTIIPTVKQLGRLHSQHGVSAYHYQTFCQALLWTLRQQLGDDFTPQVAEAWTEAFYLLAGLMKEAGERP